MFARLWAEDAARAAGMPLRRPRPSRTSDADQGPGSHSCDIVVLDHRLGVWPTPMNTTYLYVARLDTGFGLP